MATKCIVLGQEPDQKGKPIEFVKWLNPNFGLEIITTPPCGWEFIELICREYCGDLDIMLAYDDDRNMGTLYMGHWNDGFVE